MIFRASLRTAVLWVVLAWAAGHPVAAKAPPPEAPEAARVVVVANANDPDSRSLAEYYARARGLPPGNIIALPMPATETITWPEFVAQVFNPLFAELAAQEWIDALPSTLSDEYGRRKAAISGHRISYLVLTRGVPLRIDENPSWKSARRPPGGDAMAVNRAAVDGELALLAASGQPIAGFLPNPLCRLRRPGGPQLESVVRVTRLDAPTPGAVRAMIDGALLAERQGLAGRAYVDIGGQPHPEGNRWLETVAGLLTRAGFETDVDRAGGTFPPLARFDAPALYFGWYAWNVDGPFTVPGFRFPPGAVAVHIHSYSAQSLRTVSQHWCAPLIVRGATATVGNVYEPYLGLTHHLDLLADALLRGETFGAAAYYALPGLSWQGVALGDPLYRPFARTQAEQMGELDALAPELRPYVVLRQARLELQAGRKDEALRIARSLFRESPSVAVGVSVAQLAREIEGAEAAVSALAFLELLPAFEGREWGAVRSAALLLGECGAPEKALALYEKLLAVPPPVGEIPLLEEAIRLASRTGAPARAAIWQARLTAVKPPPPPPKK